MEDDVVGDIDMTEKELKQSLDAIGTLLAGKITISKRQGSAEVAVETKLHPFLAIYLLSDALGKILYLAGHTGDGLELDLSGDNARKLLHGIADQIADGIAEAAP